MSHGSPTPTARLGEPPPSPQCPDALIGMAPPPTAAVVVESPRRRRRRRRRIPPPPPLLPSSSNPPAGIMAPRVRRCTAAEIDREFDELASALSKDPRDHLTSGTEAIDEMIRSAKVHRTATKETQEEASLPVSAQSSYGSPNIASELRVEWYEKVRNNIQNQRTTELDRYLDEDPVTAQEFDIIQWWMANGSKYPTLSCIARDLLAVPASSVPSESAFSMARRTISDFRSSLTPETVEALICTQDWYRTEGLTHFNYFLNLKLYNLVNRLYTVLYCSNR